MKMERPKLRPTVTITTYSASNSSFGQNKQQNRNRLLNNDREQQEEATKSEFSTEFFNKLKSQQVAQRGHLASFSSAATAAETSNNRVLVVNLSQIKGPTGSIRGHKDVVRKSLEGIRVAYNRRVDLFNKNNNNNQTSTFVGNHQQQQQQLRSLQDYSIVTSNSMLLNSNNNNNNNCKIFNWKNMDELYCSEYLERLEYEEQDQCVAYTTSLGVIRRTFEDSKLIKSILNLNLIKYEERDIFLNQEYKHQLKMRLNSILVPAIFVDGKHIGGLKELETMNENGELLRTMFKFKMSRPAKEICLCCGNAKFIACQSCNGSRKSTIHHFKFNSIALRCIKCDKNEGLVQCPMCTTMSANLCEETTRTISESDEKSTIQKVDENNNNDESSLTKLYVDSNCGNQISNC